jgi:hypothetical protein
MAATVKEKTAGAARATKSARARYGDDLYTWVFEQVALLRDGRLDEIDAENIAEELSDVGHEQYDKLESALAVLIMHLLKWDHQPRKRSRSWSNTIRTQRRHIGRVLGKNPGLKPHIAEAVAEGYEDGRDRASSETDIAPEGFPAECPYSWDELLTREIVFEDPLRAGNAE